jgi:hypothetical protein
LADALSLLRPSVAGQSGRVIGCQEYAWRMKVNSTSFLPGSIAKAE